MKDSGPGDHLLMELETHFPEMLLVQCSLISGCRVTL